MNGTGLKWQKKNFWIELLDADLTKILSTTHIQTTVLNRTRIDFFMLYQLVADLETKILTGLYSISRSSRYNIGLWLHFFKKVYCWVFFLSKALRSFRSTKKNNRNVLLRQVILYTYKLTITYTCKRSRFLAIVSCTRSRVTVSEEPD